MLPCEILYLYSNRKKIFVGRQISCSNHFWSDILSKYHCSRSLLRLSASHIDYVFCRVVKIIQIIIEYHFKHIYCRLILIICEIVNFCYIVLIFFQSLLIFVFLCWLQHFLTRKKGFWTMFTLSINWLQWKKNSCDVSNMALIKPMLKIMYFFIVNNTNVFFRACMLKNYFVYVKKKRKLLNSFSVSYALI